MSHETGHEDTGGFNFTGFLGSLFDYFQDRKAQRQSQADAAQYAEDVAFQPFDVTDPTGKVTFTDGSAVTTLTPELQAQLDALLVQAGGFGEELQAFDPFEAQRDIYEEQQALFAPAQEQDRLALESRLLQQGLLGSTTGGMRSQALLEAQSQQNLARQAAALEQAQGIQSQLQQQQLGALSGVAALAQLPGGLLAAGGGLGGQQSAGAALGGEATLAAGDTSGGIRFGGINKTTKEQNPNALDLTSIIEAGKKLGQSVGLLSPDPKPLTHNTTGGSPFGPR